MSKEYIQVSHFNGAILGIKPREKGLQELDERDLSIHQLREEIDEFHIACLDDNYIGAVDSIIDLIYFAFGVLYKMGLNADDYTQIFDLVHTANMDKKLGVKRGREGYQAGDAVKPDGWKSPEERILEILKR